MRHIRHVEALSRLGYVGHIHVHHVGPGRRRVRCTATDFHRERFLVHVQRLGLLVNRMKPKLHLAFTRKCLCREPCTPRVPCHVGIQAFDGRTPRHIKTPRHRCFRAAGLVCHSCELNARRRKAVLLMRLLVHRARHRRGASLERARARREDLRYVVLNRPFSWCFGARSCLLLCGRTQSSHSVWVEFGMCHVVQRQVARRCARSTRSRIHGWHGWRRASHRDVRHIKAHRVRRHVGRAAHVHRC